jgi:hypothetical protein
MFQLESHRVAAGYYIVYIVRFSGKMDSVINSHKNSLYLYLRNRLF